MIIKTKTTFLKVKKQTESFKNSKNGNCFSTKVPTKVSVKKRLERTDEVQKVLCTEESHK